MNKSLYLLILCLLFTVLPAFSQSWESVKSNSLYLYGEGWGVTVAEADEQALNDLLSKISVHVIGKASHEETESVTNNGVDGSSIFRSSVKTYSQATLNNTNKVIIKNEPDAHVGRWIKRSEVDKIFEGRKFKIIDYVSSAIDAEIAGKIDVALKDYYWALCLVKSLRYPNEMKFTTDEGDKVLLINWIPRQINGIFSHLDLNLSKRNGDELEVFITYKNKPVSSVDYAFFDGRDWSNLYSAKDGIGVIELAPRYDANNIQVKFEYEYRGESRIDSEVESVMKLLPASAMRDAYKNLNTKKVSKSSISVNSNELSNSFSEISPEIFERPTLFEESTGLTSKINDIISALTKKNHESVKHYFTEEGFDIYTKLLKYGNAKVVGNPNFNFYKANDKVLARGLKMSFSFKKGARKSFIEDVIFYFNNEGLIDNITFGLGKTAENDILCKGVWNENTRFAIMSFLENYKTAYALKRLDYIRTIFDDDAVIITGRVVHIPTHRTGIEKQQLVIEHDIIKYNRFTKDSYLRQLKLSFDSKEYINLRFADNDVRKLGKGGEIFAIQISQEYFSSNYGDKGYLFLMVDINNPEMPIIKVRTWQPEKDPNFGIYGPEDFK
ncbi:MAG: LPP20 family lipoprotein [Bacteroidaceae bacterium]|nr:LPP20 family lipoprotein [Bacteroidaceae bacterium]